MKSRPRLIPILLVALAGLAGCGSEGGVVGSGISTATISGNVVEVESATLSRLAAAVPRLRIRLEEFAEVEADSGDDGSFELTGDFSGPVTVRFERLGGELLARLPLDVPSGSTVVLEDLEIGPQIPGGVRPREIRQRNLVGRVEQVDCELAVLLLGDDDQRPFRIHLLPDTEIILRSSGESGTCADIRPGAFVRVEGVVVPGDRGPSIDAATVTVSRTRPQRAP